MDLTEAAQASRGYGQRHTINNSSLPLGLQYGNSTSGNIPLMSQQRDHPESQHVDFETIVQPPDQASLPPFPSDLRQGSRALQSPAPYSHLVSSPPFSDNLALVPFPQRQQYRNSQHIQPYPLPPGNFTAIGASGYLDSHQRYSETSSNNFTGVEGSSSCNSLNYGGNPELNQMGDLGPQKNQGSQAQHCWPAPRVMDQRDAMRGLEQFQQQHRSDATSKSLVPYASGCTSNQSYPRMNANSDLGLGSPSLDSQAIANRASSFGVPPSGIDLCLIDERYPQEYGPFCEDIDKTKLGCRDLQNKLLPGNLNNLDGSLDAINFSDDANGPARLTLSMSDTIPIEAQSHAESHPPSSSWSGTRRLLFSSGSSGTTCEVCDGNPNIDPKPFFGGKRESQKNSLRRHKREAHGQPLTYECHLDKEGSTCNTLVKDARNRRKHVEKFHPIESRTLPKKDGNKRNPGAKAMLDGWFFQVPPSDRR